MRAKYLILAIVGIFGGMFVGWALPVWLEQDPEEQVTRLKLAEYDRMCHADSEASFADWIINKKNDIAVAGVFAGGTLAANSKLAGLKADQVSIVLDTVWAERFSEEVAMAARSRIV